MNPTLHDKVQVFCSLRPQKDCQLPSIKILSPTTLTISSEGKTKRAQEECNYVFRHVFTPNFEQRGIFEQVALPLLEDVINQKNGLLFTYGITGSGKTYTLTGDEFSPGIIPKSINTLFNTIDDLQCQKYSIKSDGKNGFEVQIEALEETFLEAKSNARCIRSVKRAAVDKITYMNDGTTLTTVNKNCRYAVFVSYTEIYNDAVYDLLDESNNKSKNIREDSQNNMYVNGAKEMEVKSAADAFELFALGRRRKHPASTSLNAESSQSHSIFNIRVIQLIQSKERFVPCRESRLTLLFKNYFEGEGQVRMIACINPSEQDCEENVQVMEFAEKTQDVQITKSERLKPRKTKVTSSPLRPKVPSIKFSSEMRNLKESLKHYKLLVENQSVKIAQQSVQIAHLEAAIYAESLENTELRRDLQKMLQLKNL